MSTNPQAVTKCSQADFGAPGSASEVAPGTFLKSNCPASSEIGINNVTVAVGAEVPFPLEGKVYNLEQAPGSKLSSLFGVALNLEPLGKGPIFAHTLIEGGIEYATDYHDFFDINVSPVLPLISSRLRFFGNIGTGGFLANGTNCAGPGPNTTTSIKLTDTASETAEASFTTPIGGSGCNLVPFEPTFSVAPETTESDQPDGVTIEATLPARPQPRMESTPRS